MIIVSRGKRPQPLDTTPGAIEDNMTKTVITYSTPRGDLLSLCAAHRDVEVAS